MSFSGRRGFKCHFAACDLKACHAFVVKPALAAYCRISKIVCVVCTLELELVFGCSVIFANKLSLLRYFAIACCYGQCAVIVVYVALSVAVDSCDCIGLSCFGENDFCRTDVVVDGKYVEELRMPTLKELAVELEKDNERMRILLSERVEYPDPSIKLHRLIDVINQCKGDMEPYVYECLTTEIQSKIQ